MARRKLTGSVYAAALSAALASVKVSNASQGGESESESARDTDAPGKPQPRNGTIKVSMNGDSQLHELERSVELEMAEMRAQTLNKRTKNPYATLLGFNFSNKHGDSSVLKRRRSASRRLLYLNYGNKDVWTRCALPILGTLLPVDTRGAL